MKWFLKKLTGIAIVNFILLLFAVNLIPSQMSQSAQGANDSALTSAPARDIFADLKSHNVKSDCWIGYRGHVYDITSVFGTHPGGDGIMLKYCGKDATIGFDTKEVSPVMPHSASAVGLLSQYLIQ